MRETCSRPAAKDALLERLLPAAAPSPRRGSGGLRAPRVRATGCGRPQGSAQRGAEAAPSSGGSRSSSSSSGGDGSRAAPRGAAAADTRGPPCAMVALRRGSDRRGGGGEGGRHRGGGRGRGRAVTGAGLSGSAVRGAARPAGAAPPSAGPRRNAGRDPALAPRGSHGGDGSLGAAGAPPLVNFPAELQGEAFRERPSKIHEASRGGCAAARGALGASAYRCLFGHEGWPWLARPSQEAAVKRSEVVRDQKLRAEEQMKPVQKYSSCH